MWSTTGPGPRKPSRFDSSRTATSSADGVAGPSGEVAGPSGGVAGEARAYSSSSLTAAPSTGITMTRRRGSVPTDLVSTRRSSTKAS